MPVSRLLPCVGVTLAALAAGCTHVYPQPGQSIRVEVADAAGQKMAGVECRLGNARGTWSMVAPGDVRVISTASELTVTCMRPGLPDGYARLLASSVTVDPERIVDPGGVRTFLDPVMYPSVRYADRVTVVLGRVTVVDRNSQEKASASPAAPADPGTSPTARPIAARR